MDTRKDSTLEDQEIQAVPNAGADQILLKVNQIIDCRASSKSNFEGKKPSLWDSGHILFC